MKNSIKKIILSICLFTGVISVSKAQGNLQFNRATFIELNGLPAFTSSGSWGICDTNTITVPSNKTLKLEHFTAYPYDTASGTIPNSAFDGIAFILLNGVKLNHLYSNGPIWLPSGTYKIKLVGATSNLYCKGFISAIEYNIIP